MALGVLISLMLAEILAAEGGQAVSENVVSVMRFGNFLWNADYKTGILIVDLI